MTHRLQAHAGVSSAGVLRFLVHQGWACVSAVHVLWPSASFTDYANVFSISQVLWPDWHAP